LEKSLIPKNSSETPIPTYPKKEKRTKGFQNKVIENKAYQTQTSMLT
jgi:hypothetical protein